MEEAFHLDPVEGLVVGDGVVVVFDFERLDADGEAFAEEAAHLIDDGAVCEHVEIEEAMAVCLAELDDCVCYVMHVFVGEQDAAVESFAESLFSGLILQHVEGIHLEPVNVHAGEASLDL